MQNRTAGAGPRQATGEHGSRTLGVLLTGLLVASCGSKGGAVPGSGIPGPGPGPGPVLGSGTLVIELTDAPFLHAQVREARLVLAALELHEDPAATEGFTPVLAGAPVEVDLAALRNGRSVRLAPLELPAGTYRVARLRLADAELVLEGGQSFAPADDRLRVSPTALAGQLVFLGPELVVRPEEESVLLLDFDLTRTFVPEPAGDPRDARLFLVQPVVRAGDPQSCGTLRGFLSEPGAGGTAVPLGDATVYLMPTGFTGVPRSISGTASDPDGGYAFLGVPPGVYDLWVMKAGRETTSVGHAVASGTTLVDVHLE